jgi:integrase
VFTDDLGRPLAGETVTHSLQALKAAGLPKFRFHDLRHSAATFLIAAGIPLKHVSDLLGHSTIAITADIYGHLLDESNRAAGEAIGRTLFGAR